MSTLKVINSIHPSGSTNNLVFDSSGNTTAGGTLAMSSSFLRNRIINGAMVIDQRNAGASVATTTTAASTYALDRWAYQVSAASKFTVQQNGGSVTPPTGYTYYLGCTSTSAYSVGTNDYFAILQKLEGYNTADFGWGASGASTITISFWVRSSLTGSFGGALRNSSGGRYYLFSYTISAANTWEYKTVTVAGDTTGTYQTTNSTSFEVWWSLGAGSGLSGTAGSWSTNNQTQPTGSTSVVGTNGATFYITGVQLEVGSVATPFERRLYGQELVLCQRYLYRLTPTTSSTNPFFATASMYNSTAIFAGGQFPQQMRTIPTLTLEGAVSNYSFFTMGTGTYLPTTSLTLNAVTTNSFFLLQGAVASGGTTGQISYLTGNGQNTYGIQFSAEL